MLYSFDVFDTVITRKMATPQGVWKLMQEELLREKSYDDISEYVKKNFYALRIYIERLVRINDCYNGVEDISLPQIYDGFVKTGYMDKEQSQRLETLEKTIEISNVLGISENIEMIKRLLQDGRRVIFISDMYLPEKTIRKMLSLADPVLKELPLYVSGEYKKSKWTGGLYHLIREKEQVEFPEWIHKGDNMHSDIEIPKCLGIKTNPFFFETSKEIENYILLKEKSSVYAEFAAGASRYIRMGQNKGRAWEVGVTAGANILLPYVLWILHVSRERGIKRLYFIARDGYILKQMFDKIIRTNGDLIETKYIYGSRKAWRPPGISETNDDLMELLSWSHPPKIDTVDKLAEVFELTASELLSFLPQGFDRQSSLTSYTLYIVVELLNQNLSFKKYLINQHKAKRNLVKRYLDENIDIHDDCFAFVELAGSGYTQRCLADILSEMRRDQYPFNANKGNVIKTFYFKMDRVNRWKECQQFVFLPENNVKNLIIEMVCRAFHGQTIGYEEKNGCIRPILDAEGTQLLDYKYNEYIEGILEYTEYVCKKNSQMLVTGQMEGLNVSSAYLSYLLESGSSEEFLYYADMPNNLTGRTDKAESFAPALTDEQLEKIFYSERFKDRESIYKGTCFELSLERCSKEQNEKIRNYQKKAGEEDQHHILNKSFIDCFPVDILGKRIILYGAGRYGNQLYDILESCRDKKIVQWIDCNYENIKKSKIPLEGLDRMGQKEYDCVLIGVVSKEIAEEIRKELIGRGIPGWRIYWLGKTEINQYLVWNQQFRWV